MLKTLGVVQACCHARQTCCRAARKLGGRSVLEWVIRRVTDSLRLDGVIVLVCDEADHRFMRSLAPADVPVYVGTRPDGLGRFAQALEQFSTQGVIRVRGDSLFIDPALIDRLVAVADANPRCDYVSYCLRDGQPAILSPVGIYAEWIRTSALHKAARRAKDPHHREHVTKYIYANPDKFNIRFIPAPAESDRDDLRLTIERDEDWDHVLTIFDALGPDKLDWRGAANLLDGQPALRNRMAAINRETVHADW
jgi:spore coat polysaccharide biosynthesis protein SpsF